MKKNVKVFSIEAQAANGNGRTIHAITSLDMTLADFCKSNNIPLLSIISVKETTPMTERDALNYVIHHHAAVLKNPNSIPVKTNIKLFAA